jgi:uncharacterized membrane protein
MGADALDALGEYGGTVLKTSPSEDAERVLQAALHGTPLLRQLPPTSDRRASA